MDTYYIQEKDDCSIQWLQNIDTPKWRGIRNYRLDPKCRLYLNTSDIKCKHDDLDYNKRSYFLPISMDDEGNNCKKIREKYISSKQKCWINCSEQKYSLTDPEEILFPMMWSFIFQLFVGYLFTKYYSKECCINCNIYIKSIVGCCVIMAAIYTMKNYNQIENHEPFEQECLKQNENCVFKY